MCLTNGSVVTSDNSLGGIFLHWCSAPSGRTGHGREAGCPAPPAQIPACAANAPGSCRRSDVIGHRGLGGPCSSDPWARNFGDMPIPALCPGHA